METDSKMGEMVRFWLMLSEGLLGLDPSEGFNVFVPLVFQADSFGCATIREASTQQTFNISPSCRS